MLGLYWRRHDEIHGFCEGVAMGSAGLIFQILVALCVTFGVMGIGLIFVKDDSLDARMKSVVTERNRLRNRSRQDLARGNNLRPQAKPFIKQIVDGFNLAEWLGNERFKTELAKAGFRGPQAEATFLFFRLISPIGIGLVLIFYIFVLRVFDLSSMAGAGVVLVGILIGTKAPELFLSNTISKRQESIQLAFPDALDLLLICVESGMSIEAALRRVAQEITVQSVPLSEEMSLTMAELSYLPDRKLAYENFAARAGTDSAKQIALVLAQAEQFGTPLGSALRIVSMEGREKRLMEAEKKAATIPPKLTIPLIVFLLPVLFVALLAPPFLRS
jgi:tight adherence protein C